MVGSLEMKNGLSEWSHLDSITGNQNLGSCDYRQIVFHSCEVKVTIRIAQL